jgi:hypothetical protein
MSEEIYARMHRLAKDYAEAEAKRIYLVEFRKSKKSMLMKAAEVAKPGMSAAAQEREALKGLEVATQKAIEAKWELTIIQTQFESWRTKQATARAEMNMR